MSELERLTLVCPFCGKTKGWEEFHYGGPNESTPLACAQCVFVDNKVERTFLMEERKRWA